MAARRLQVLEKINSEWTNLETAVANIPTDQFEWLPVVGNWSAKDMMGHITTWEVETMNNVERFLDPKIGEMRSYPDPDGFKERTSEEKRDISLIDIQRDFWETHSPLEDMSIDTLLEWVKENGESLAAEAKLSFTPGHRGQVARFEKQRHESEGHL